MTSVPQHTRRELGEVQLHVSRYDQVSSLLISLLILVGSAVALMFVIWLTANLVFRPQPPVVKLVENVSGRGPHAEGFERDMEAPGFEELPDLMEPQLEADLEAVTEDASAVAASLDVLDTISTVTYQGEDGRGDSRPPGPLGEGDDIIPRWERWEIRWTSTSVAAYARQLDFFGIELGALGGRPVIDYASGLARPTPDRRAGSSREESRLHMTWNKGTLEKFDRQLLERAGVTTANRFVKQFYPEQVENQLASLEMQSAGGLTVQDIRKTIFGVRAAGRGFEFFVMELRPR